MEFGVEQNSKRINSVKTRQNLLRKRLHSISLFEDIQLYLMKISRQLNKSQMTIENRALPPLLIKS